MWEDFQRHKGCWNQRLQDSKDRGPVIQLQAFRAAPPSLRLIEDLCCDRHCAQHTAADKTGSRPFWSQQETEKQAIPEQYDGYWALGERSIVGASQSRIISGPETRFYQFIQNWLGRQERGNIKKRNILGEQGLSSTYQTHQTLKDKLEYWCRSLQWGLYLSSPSFHLCLAWRVNPFPMSRSPEMTRLLSELRSWRSEYSRRIFHQNPWNYSFF